MCSDKCNNRDESASSSSPPCSNNNNIRLAHLALHKILDAMQHTTNRMDEYIANEMGKLDVNTSRLTLVSTAATTPWTGRSGSSGLEADIESLSSSLPATPIKFSKYNNASTSFSSPSCPVDPHVLKKAAMDMLAARQYLLNTLQDELHPFLMKHVIARAVNEHSVQLVRLAIKSSVQVLDFRALQYWLCRSDVPQHLAIGHFDSSSTLNASTSEISMSDLTTASGCSSPAWTASIDDDVGSDMSSSCTKSFTFANDFFKPPNEFDWFSRDKMGKILTLAEACELFSIIKMADCAYQLKELYMNAKRPSYLSCSEDALISVTDTLADLQCLSKLVLRGMCDDEMLKAIGRNVFTLKHLDVSGSHFVTDTGIQHLFFQERNQNTALYLISAWVTKNMDKMNPCTHSLNFLDYSWTGVTAMGRKMVQLLPGSYLFKRLMSSRGETDSYGHHIFIREPACMQDLIPSNVDSSQCKIFERHLVQHVGEKGAKGFLKIAVSHPWRKCVLTLHTSKKTDQLRNMPSAYGIIPTNNSSHSEKNQKYYGIITPNQTEKRIQGIVYWSNGVISQVYTIYPVNINTLGMLNHLRLYRGIVSEVWRMQYSLLPDLVHLDIFAEPTTFINIIQFCPSLRRLRIRIRRHSIHDVQLIKAMEISMCRNTLEDLWIAPGKFVEDSKPTVINDDDDKSVRGVESNSTKGNASNVSSFNSFSQKSQSKEKVTFPSVPLQPLELVQLSLDCIDALLQVCPKLKRLGDLSTWTEVEAEDLYVYCEQLKAKNSKVLIIWANMNLPNYAKKSTKDEKGKKTGVDFYNGNSDVFQNSKVSK